MAMPKTVWISRPQNRCAALAQSLANFGLEPLVRPAICIEPFADLATNAALARYVRDINTYHWHIVVSAAAADCLKKINIAHAVALPTLTLGEETAAALPAVYACKNADATATLADSRRLLEYPALAAPTAPGRPARIALLGGISETMPAPAPHLASELTHRGFCVDAIPCYRRTAMPVDDELSARGQSGGISAAVAYSRETLDAMLGMLTPPASWFYATPLFVIHANIQQHATARGFTHTTVAAPAALPAALHHHFSLLASW